jgi:hypothetical protein
MLDIGRNGNVIIMSNGRYRGGFTEVILPDIEQTKRGILNPLKLCLILCYIIENVLLNYLLYMAVFDKNDCSILC